MHAPYDIVMSDSSGAIIISTLSHKLQDFQKNVCFDFRYNCCLKHFSFQEKFGELLSKMYIGVRVKYPLFLSGMVRSRTKATEFSFMYRKEEL